MKEIQIDGSLAERLKPYHLANFCGSRAFSDSTGALSSETARKSISYRRPAITKKSRRLSQPTSPPVRSSRADYLRRDL
jgi:hypothetical protein